MPFVMRKVEPRLLCRGHVPAGPLPQVGAELDSVAHGALTGCLKQLASVLTLAEDIFAELTSELTFIADRSGALRIRVDKVDERLGTIDPKKIPVPESDISTFASRKEHFHAKNDDSKLSLFNESSRPKILRELYEAAAVVAVRSLDSISRVDGNNSTELYLCTPVLGKRRHDRSLDIESRVPAAIEDLRRWTSTEALGDVTVPPDCMSRILADTTDDDAVDHKLPSPEEQVQAVALKFPAELVAVDVSGRGFERMSVRRRSLLSPSVGQDNQEVSVKRRSRPRRPRGKRRNTIAGIDQKEIRQAIGGETTTEGNEEEEESVPRVSGRAHRSASTDILGSKKESPSEKKSHFNTLKAWGMSRLKLISPKSSQNVQELSALTNTSTAILSNQNNDQQLHNDDVKTGSPEETNIYETVTMRRRKEKFHERKPSSSSSSGKSTSSIPVSIPITERQANVKLRESAAQRRERRKGNREDAPHSSSGNWSASSESGRASIGSETTTTTHPPRSTTTASIGTSSTSLSHVRRAKGRDMSASSSVTSEGTLTPDIIHDITAVPFSDDGETSSVYSCDTEGYYTSFHVDSGLKTLREEESLPQTPLTKSSDLGPDLASPIAENEYELFGRGSTSTTTSSAGTVCTTLLAPPPPERKSSLTVVAMVHGQNKNGGQSPDSGHNTSSSPVESASSPACTGRSCSEFEYSESSDLEGCERIERIRSKTAINASRIPSMCVITPPGSDDESTARDSDNFQNRLDIRTVNSNFGNPGSVLMSATVGTSKMEVINGQDKNPYATVQTVLPQVTTNDDKTARNSANTIIQGSNKVSPLSGVLGKLRCVLPGGKRTTASNKILPGNFVTHNQDSGDYVTIADVRNNNNKRSDHHSSSSNTNLNLNLNNRTNKNSQPASATYANSDLFKKDAEYVSLSELPKKQDSSLERRRQGARVTLDSDGKVVYSSDSLKRRKGAHTTFNPGPFVKDGISPATSPLLHRSQATIRSVNNHREVCKNLDTVDCGIDSSPAPTSPQLGKLIIRASKSPDRSSSPNYVRTPSTVVGPTSPTSPQKHARAGAYVNVQGEEDSALLAVPKDSTSQDASCQQPPPYIEPPQIKNRKDLKNTKILPLNVQQNVQTSNLHRNNAGDCKNEIFNTADNNRVNYKENRDISGSLKNEVNTETWLSDNRIKGVLRQQGENRGGIIEIRNANNDLINREQFYVNQNNSHGQNNGQQFYTLPSYRNSTRDIEPPRSVTPDITRGLCRTSLNPMQMMATRGQNYNNKITNKYSSDEHLVCQNSNKNQLQRTGQQNQEQNSSVLRNRFIVPASLSAVGYRFVATPPPCPASPSGSRDGLKNVGLSPIGPIGSNKGFYSSTPGGSLKTVVTTTTTTTGNNLLSSGRNTPTNLILSPTKSTMSNEELFAAIHKSKRRLNIREDNDMISTGAEANTSFDPNQVSSRHSWSPESNKTPVVPKSGNPSPTTSRLDFKRLLLQQSVKSGPTRLSAAEQLKLSRQQSMQQQQNYLNQEQNRQNLIPQPVTPVKVLSPRTTWRFHSPRSDVLSSTIIEDAAAEEKAMKPSPENSSPISRVVNSKRQLNLFGDLLPDIKNGKLLNVNVPNSSIITRDYNQPQNMDINLKTNLSSKKLEAVNTEQYNRKNIDTIFNKTPTNHHTTAIENRRINNQIARAQFLANFPTTVIPTSSSSSSSLSSLGQNKTNYFVRHNRARSESPQHGVVQNVSRSPSAPTLETAL